MTDPDPYDMMRRGDYQMMDGDGSGWLEGFAVLTLVLLLFALLAVLANLFLHVFRKPGPGRSAAEVAGAEVAAKDEPRSVLDSRLARGEVTAKEYRAVRTLLDEG
ncbi:MAG: hypothetical protein LH477_12385 [Nocardioides sp.]|nr:hypothetical protein [Nocardioides sp.]